jgi:tRNA(Ile)-lysidine synthase
VRDKLLRYIGEQRLIRAGDRVAPAVSGGADSVALLRALLDLRAELGIVLAVAHFNHGLRGAESDADQAFVAELAREHGLEFFVGLADVRDHALLNKLSLEAAGRGLRYRWFARLAEAHRLDAIATAHTLDDQAETVLLKFLRGAGTKGLAGIYPALFLDDEEQDGVRKARVIRPLLSISRDEVERYLGSLGQSWREDESNLDHRFLRNRVRHELLPMLEREFNPNIRQSLSDSAEIARAEEDYWQRHVEPEIATRAGADGLIIKDFAQLAVALQRRVLKRYAEGQGLALDFEHIERLRFCAVGDLPRAEVTGGKVAQRIGTSLRVSCALGQEAGAEYQYRLAIPGEIFIAPLSLKMKAKLVSEDVAAGLPPGELLDPEQVGGELTVRNWHPGDRFWPAYSRSEEKLKRLFAEKRIPAEQRATWPVAIYEGEIVWVRGFRVGSAFRWQGKSQALKIEIARAV